MAFRNAPEARHDLTGGAEAALHTFMLYECSLKGMKFAVLFKAFNRFDTRSTVHSRKRQTGQDTLAVDKDRASSARTLIAPFLRPREI